MASLLLFKINYDLIIDLIWATILGPPIIFAAVGILWYKKDQQKRAKTCFIISGVYLVIALGVCEAWLWI